MRPLWVLLCEMQMKPISIMRIRTCKIRVITHLQAVCREHGGVQGDEHPAGIVKTHRAPPPLPRPHSRQKPLPTTCPNTRQRGDELCQYTWADARLSITPGFTRLGDELQGRR